MLKNDLVANESEQSVIGGLLLEPTAWDIASQILKESDFSHACHKVIYRAFTALATQNVPFDVVTVSDWLEKQNLLSAAGGFEYLVNVARNTPSAANITTYATVVKNASMARQLKSVGEAIAKLPNDASKTPVEMLNEASAMIESIGEGNATSGGFKRVKTILTGVIDHIEAALGNPNYIIGIPTGFTDIDRKIAGLQKSDLMIIAGRPGMGKSAFAMNIAENVAENSNLPVAIFSLEMPNEQLAMRLLASMGRIDQQKIRTGRLDDDDFPRLTIATHRLSEFEIHIDDTPAVDLNYIRARSRKLKKEFGGLGLIIIDYLQLITSKSKENRSVEVSEISRGLKALAKELDVPVIALSQLNRGLENRQDKRPQLADLRESGSIEQDADLVLFIYRDEVYNEESPDKGTAEIIIAKQRNGPIGMVRLAFRGQFTRFENFSRGDDYE